MTTNLQAEKEVETSSENKKKPRSTSPEEGCTTSEERRRTLPHLAQHLRARWSRQTHGRSPPSPLPLIQAVSMISHYPLATLLPWPAAPHHHHHHPDPDCTLLLEGEGGVALQRYQARSPESSPRHWVSTPVIVSALLDSSLWVCYCLMGSSASPAQQFDRCRPPELFWC